MLQPSEISARLGPLDNGAKISGASTWLAAYTETVLAYTFAGQPTADGLGAPSAEPGANPPEITASCDKIIRLFKSSARPNLLLFGLGNGDLPAALLNRLKALWLEKNLPQQGVNFILCSQQPDQTRAVLRGSAALRQAFKGIEALLPSEKPLTENSLGPTFWAEGSEDVAPITCNLIVDTSPRALLLLLSSLGLTLQNTLFYLNPCLEPGEANELRQTMQLVQRTRTASFIGKFGSDQPDLAKPAASAGQVTGAGLGGLDSSLNSLEAVGPASLSVLAILHPEEPQLEDFCRQIPPEVKELVIVWDSDQPVGKKLPLACPLLQISRPLNGDFAAQRNFALSLCSGKWVLALDGDERLAASAWQQILHISGNSDLAACFLPRLTLYPDNEHFRMGYGLWPDLQLRLFRRGPKVLFERPVHEILTGIAGPSALLPHAPIWHYSYTLKSRAELQQRLQVFNRAAGREVHKLSAEYPHLPLSWHEKFLQLNHNNDLLLLP